MTKEELKARTKKFALDIIKLVDELPNTKAGHTVGNQIVRSSTSVAANYRASCKAKSAADFIYKMSIVEEEADESLFCLEIIDESKMLPRERVQPLLIEANELTAIFTASGKTAKSNINIKKQSKHNKS